MRKSKKKPWQTDLDKLTSKQLARYEDSLDVLRMMRAGTSFSKATKTVGGSPPTAKKFLGTTIFKKKKRVIAKQNDQLIRKLKIYENGKQVSVQVRGNKRAKLIGQYHSAVGQFMDKNNRMVLKQLENKILKDIFWKTHRFETDADKIIEILSRREEREFFTIYESG